MSRSATPATRNEATRRLKLPKITTSAELTIGTAIWSSRARLRTVANTCDHKRSNPQNPRVKREPLLRIREKWRKSWRGCVFSVQKKWRKKHRENQQAITKYWKMCKKTAQKNDSKLLHIFPPFESLRSLQLACILSAGFWRPVLVNTSVYPSGVIILNNTHYHSKAAHCRFS